MEITINADDIKLIRKFEEIKNKGYYASGEQVTAVYNRVLGKNLNSTSCGSCLRGRIQELVNALNAFEAKLKKQEEMAQEVLKNNEVNNSPSDENNEPTEQKRRVGRPKKS